MTTIAKLAVELGLSDEAFARSIEEAREKLNKLGETMRTVGTAQAEQKPRELFHVAWMKYEKC